MLDANILVRAVLGPRVRGILEAHAEKTFFLIPEEAFLESQRHLTAIVARRGGAPEKAQVLLRAIAGLGELVPAESYAKAEAEARLRLRSRDPNDWPVLATALAFDCPIWTEDTDFFGCGVATWTTDRVEIFLKSAAGA